MDIFEKAKKAYKRSTESLMNICRVYKKVNNNTNYNVLTTLRQFDVLLQYSMMEVALNNYHFDIGEVNFIRNLADYYDFRDYLESIGIDDITWNDIYNTSESDLIALLKKIKNDVRELSLDFVMIFSGIDAFLTEHDFLAELIEDVSTILVAVASSDGHFDKKQITKGALILEIIPLIGGTKHLIEEKLQGRSDHQPKNSLKDFIVKKKQLTPTPYLK